MRSFLVALSSVPSRKSLSGIMMFFDRAFAA